MKIARRLAHQWFRLQIPEGGEGGGGGGEGGDGDLPKTKKELQDLVNSSVNGALSGYLKRGTFNEAIGSSVKSAVEEAVKGLKPASNEGGGEGGEGGEKKSSIKDDPAFKAMEAQNAELRKRLDTEAAQRKADQEAAERKEDRSRLDRALSKAGVTEARLAGASAFLYHDRNVVKRNDEGITCIEFQRDGYKELVPIEEGVDEWIKTDEGKGYLPPADTGGSGNQGGNRPGAKPQFEGDKAAAADFVGNALLKARRGGAI